MPSALNILIINGTSRSKTPSGPASVGAGHLISAFVEQRVKHALDKSGRQATLTTIEPVSHFSLPLEIGTVPVAMKYVGMTSYANEGVQRWSEQVKAADAVIIVSPQYNNMPTPTLLLAIDHLGDEWESKLIGVVTYGPGGGEHTGTILRNHCAPILKMKIVEPFGIVKYTQEDGGYNRIAPGSGDSIIEPQASEVDKVVEAVLGALSS